MPGGQPDILKIGYALKIIINKDPNFGRILLEIVL